MTNDTHTTDETRRSGPYTFKYNDDADTITITAANGPPVVLTNAGLDAMWPEDSDVTIGETFCEAVGGHAYQITGAVHTNPKRRKRSCKLCGHAQIESPKTWRDAE